MPIRKKRSKTPSYKRLIWACPSSLCRWAAPLPKWIDHLAAANLTDGYDFARVQSLYADVTAPGAKLPLKVLTPTARKANRRTGLRIGIGVLIMFAAGLYGVGVSRYLPRPLRNTSA
ncbi:MAG: hypothetical protein U0670_15820 [Anaerolineae bacterium]